MHISFLLIEKKLISQNSIENTFGSIIRSIWNSFLTPFKFSKIKTLIKYHLFYLDLDKRAPKNIQRNPANSSQTTKMSQSVPIQNFMSIILKRAKYKNRVYYCNPTLLECLLVQ